MKANTALPGETILHLAAYPLLKPPLATYFVRTTKGEASACSQRFGPTLAKAHKNRPNQYRFVILRPRWLQLGNRRWAGQNRSVNPSYNVNNFRSAYKDEQKLHGAVLSWFGLLSPEARRNRMVRRWYDPRQRLANPSWFSVPGEDPREANGRCEVVELLASGREMFKEAVLYAVARNKISLYPFLHAGCFGFAFFLCKELRLLRCFFAAVGESECSCEETPQILQHVGHGFQFGMLWTACHIVVQAVKDCCLRDNNSLK
jgi:hypothetical protein